MTANKTKNHTHTKMDFEARTLALCYKMCIKLAKIMKLIKSHCFP